VQNKNRQVSTMLCKNCPETSRLAAVSCRLRAKLCSGSTTSASQPLFYAGVCRRDHGGSSWRDGTTRRATSCQAEAHQGSRTSLEEQKGCALQGIKPTSVLTSPCAERVRSVVNNDSIVLIPHYVLRTAWKRSRVPNVALAKMLHAS